MPNRYDVIIIGAGAAGLMCALTVGGKGKRVLLLERNKKPGAKILISGGGRCNFTNQDTVPTAYLSKNPHFAKSALSRYTPWDFMDLIAGHGLTWHEKTLGQLFCDQGSKAILKVLLDECQKAGVTLQLNAEINSVKKGEQGFEVSASDACHSAVSLVVASGGVSIPQMGATDLAYRLAEQFGLKIVKPEPALVPLTFEPDVVANMKELSGVAADCSIAVEGMKSAPVFRENLLFTHRGLSGPAVLQISSYWELGQSIDINLVPSQKDVYDELRNARETAKASTVRSYLSKLLPDRLAEQIAQGWPGRLAEQSNKSLTSLADRLGHWQVTPNGSEGFKKAEVTKGGVCTSELSSKTMEVKSVPGLYFIGEGVDVTGWLGGYNFQWAWASGHAAATAIAHI
ncbi:MAG: NAD(P)/FAD-dependent oxidoreductase [Kordiimonadaceae bacterium]|nr:NAD(P)/FAD-dependent oxidoreductase [Kordiimonadaceae bacterium]MBO6568789.1 NAD(P)/FAD-dependent oxidoreductase [Kordiimonadaceae bacterium]MBO6965236.1 NAD(P)/FAD-dependent oxidoreductase [Kordiimonadaceae bacterium]